MNKIKVIMAICLAWSALVLISCANPQADNQISSYVTEKASPLLINQVNLRKAQIANPTLQTLEQMKNLGMKVDNLGSQQIFIYLQQALTAAQTEELRAMGLTLYTDSWIPPVGTHPTGFLIAAMPVDKLDALAKKDYVVKLDTAERQLQPQNDTGPQ